MVPQPPCSFKLEQAFAPVPGVQLGFQRINIQSP
jgi:hypothetical protein